MNKFSIIACLLAGSLVGTSMVAESAIKLSGVKGVVIPSEQRATVLAVAEQYLGDKQSTFLSELEELESPFGGVAKLSAEELEEQIVTVEPEVTVIVYDDASVLKVIARNFSKQVRGTLARGTNRYIQLQGGNLMKPGASFPARVPEAEDKTYTVTLVEVTPEGYTLALGQATQTLTYSELPNSGKNSIQKNP
jgi:uncharacterized protein YqiB (DUF1249 family)